MYRTTATPDEEQSTDLVLKDVNFSYNGERILQDVNLAITSGEFIGIIGPNGGGKTTLLRLILGLLTPQSGSIRVFGQPPAKSCRRIGYVPQHIQFDQRFPATVFDIVQMGQVGKNGWGYISKQERRLVEEALESVDLAPLQKKRFSDLSGGQRQRVLIARSLASRPELLLFDEPTANVDSSSGEQVYSILEELNKRMTILVVSHDIAFVNRQITSVVCVNHQVAVHPTSNLDGTNIIDLYGHDISLVRHDHRCSKEGHACSSL